MGDRNPWRPSIDTKTGWLYWGEVGPDANADTRTTRTGMDEFNQARGPGYFGWPYFIGENVAYPMYNYLNDSVSAGKDPAKPTNYSVNNTRDQGIASGTTSFHLLSLRDFRKISIGWIRIAMRSRWSDLPSSPISKTRNVDIPDTMKENGWPQTSPVVG